MNQSLPPPQTSSHQRRDSKQLPLLLENPQARERIPDAIRLKCLPLWRELLQVVALKGKTQNGGAHE